MADMGSLDQILRLSEIIKSHCDTPVRDLLSGQEPSWICAKTVSDLREEVRELSLAEDANYELNKENQKLRATITTWTEDVPRDEQIEIVKKAIRDGDL